MSREAKQAVYSLPRSHVVWQVIEYAHLHRAEVLTRKDVATKFDIASTDVDSMLAPAVAAGLLKRDRDSENGVVWRRPQRLLATFPAPFTGHLAAATRAGSNGSPHALRYDIGSIVIEAGVPLLERPKVTSQWQALFERMKPGDSFQVPKAVTSALAHAKLKYCKTTHSARFATRKVSDTHSRIWRLA